MTLTAFILARIDADEQEADTKHDRLDCDLALLETFGECSCGYPARVLAECAALREVVELHPPTTAGGLCETCSSLDGPYAFDDPENLVSYPCPTLRALAAIWRDHPDYRPEEWA